MSLASGVSFVADKSLADGAWSYVGGVSGTVVISSGKRIVQISAIGAVGGASLTINGGNTVPIPVNVALTITPQGNLVDPTIVFTNTQGYFVEMVL